MRVAAVVVLFGACALAAACGDAETRANDDGGARGGDAGDERDASSPDGGDDGGGGDADEGDGGAGVGVRVLAGNLSSGTKSSWDPGEGIRIVQALAPDVAVLQEVNYGTSSTADVRRFVDTAFGASFAYAREPNVAGGLPNAVVSRWPLAGSGVWTDPYVANRSFVWAHVDVPGPTDLWAVSVHLLTSSASSRAQETTELAKLVQQNVPAGALLVIGGDWNTESRDETAVTNLAAVVVTGAPWPVDQQDDAFTNAPRNKPYDWLVASPSLAALETPTTVGGASFPHGLVFDTRVFSPISAVPPARATDSAASGMQHMAVVREFFVR